MMSNSRLRQIALAVALCWVGTVSAASCDEDEIKSKTNDGTYLIMQSGDVYEVLAGDSLDSSLWLPPADVMICSRLLNYQGRQYLLYDIINKDENEKVTAIKRH